MTYKNDQKYRASSSSGKKAREAAQESAECRRHGYTMTDKTLGTGAYAKVRLARVGEKKLEKCAKLKQDLNEKGHDMVAIKIISKKHAPSEYIHKFMPREIDALKVTYKHPHLIQLYEVFRSETRIFLVMDYAPNGDILSYINECVLETGCAVKEETARRLFKHIISGVAHCHQLNVVHRDLKCENILLDENDNVKISDFGFACRFPTNRCNMLSTFCGSYAYAAPEILSARNYDGKLADIWSLGVVLYAMVNGRLPFNDQNLNTLLEQTRRKLNFQPWVSSDCADLIRRLLRTRPLTRLRMHEIIAHPWVRKNLNTKNLTAFPSSQAFLKVIQESSDENLTGKADKYASLKEPTLVLKPNGKTVRLDPKADTKTITKDKEEQASKPAARHHQSVHFVPSPECPHQKSPKPDTPPSCTSTKKATPTNKTADSTRIKNLYRRILKPSLGTEYVFEVVENEQEQERLIEKRLRMNAWGKSPPPKTPRRILDTRKQIRKAVQPGASSPQASSPSPRVTKAYAPTQTMSDTTNDSLAGYTTTLVPVDIREKIYMRPSRDGSPGERESITRIRYRLGLSPTPTPTGQADRKKYSASEPASLTTGKKPGVSNFIHVHGKTELWKRALRGTLQKEASKKNDLRLESPSPRASPVTASGSANGGSSKFKAKMRVLARRNLLNRIMLKPEPEVRTSELLNQLQKNLPLLSETVAV
ncbi:testis-specific serine/threonine-protein kinase 1-like [Asterias rubens]|uniref:testis-specific serine/threonine-protein kinase 1-like n=1 Tax=Asterias rubens TaxID=7604 RepID=UPI0014559B46|nr:testis-specific serine/threonine-protein kinase 1-like [Asterias rubens]